MFHRLREFLGQSYHKYGTESRTLYLRTSWMLMRDTQIEGSFPHVKAYLARKETVNV